MTWLVLSRAGSGPETPNRKPFSSDSRGGSGSTKWRRFMEEKITGLFPQSMIEFWKHPGKCHGRDHLQTHTRLLPRPEYVRSSMQNTYRNTIEAATATRRQRRQQPTTSCSPKQPQQPQPTTEYKQNTQQAASNNQQSHHYDDDNNRQRRRWRRRQRHGRRRRRRQS